MNLKMRGAEELQDVRRWTSVIRCM